MAQDITARVLGQNPDGTLNVQMTSGNPFNPASAGNSMQQMQQGGSMYSLKVGGQIINFATEADMLKAQMVMMSAQGGANPMFATQQAQTSWIPLAANAAAAVNDWFTRSNLQNRVTDLKKQITRLDENRERLNNLRSSYADLVPVLLEILEGERATTNTQMAIAEDLISANGIALGVDVARTAESYLSRQPSGGGLLTGGSFPTLAAGAVAIGLLTQGKK